MRAVAGERFPTLLDPSFEPGRSLLFELTSDKAAWQIVLRYPRDDLTLLAVIDHATLRMADDREVQQLAVRHGLNAMTWIPLAESISDLCRQVREWRGREGVVVRAGQHLVKIKALSYLTLHRLRSDLTVRRIRCPTARPSPSDMPPSSQAPSAARRF